MSPREKLFIYLFIGLKTANQEETELERELALGVNKVALGLFYGCFFKLL